jgi:hypothetical protein
MTAKMEPEIYLRKLLVEAAKKLQKMSKQMQEVLLRFTSDFQL